MAGNKFLDETGLAILWERIRQLVYECGCNCAVTYKLVSNGNEITLVGSDGSRSTVEVEAVTSCSEER